MIVFDRSSLIHSYSRLPPKNFTIALITILVPNLQPTGYGWVTQSDHDFIRTLPTVRE